VRAALLLSLALIAFAAPAQAQQQQVAPPGNSAIDQYLETVPGADGNTPLDQNAGAPGAARGGSPGLSPAAKRELESLGPEGKAASRLYDASLRGQPAPTAAARSAAQADPVRRADDGDSGVPAVLDGILADDLDAGMGALLPLLLAGSLVAAIAAGALRRRRRT
jgi:hypothetical protein